MADNNFKFGISVETSEATASLSQLQSAFQSTTSSAASQWTEASSTITVSFQKMADEAEKATGRTKEQIDKASQAAGAFGDVIGVKVPEGMQKMLAQSELIGPILEKAFAPLAIIQLLQWVAEASDKVSGPFAVDDFVAVKAADFYKSRQLSTSGPQQIQYQSVKNNRFQQGSIRVGIWFGTRCSTRRSSRNSFRFNIRKS